MSTEEKPDVKPEGAKHSLRIRLRDQDELTIKIKPNTPMKKVYAAISANKGLAPGSFKLTHDGTLVKEDDTPATLDFEDDECLDVQMNQIGGGGRKQL
ncbi:uncharacterized protein JCM6883_006953 [Sporobolomyces salmoneus]|uniref:uncharacterized protein n=1 Tax=Sporobolomyces salmoneus TaxID=183962 RepID=UPI00316EE4CC